MILRVLLALVYLESEEIEEHDALAHAYLASIEPTAVCALVGNLLLLLMLLMVICGVTRLL